MGEITRRDFIKIGTISGISISLGMLPFARANETNTGPNNLDWVGADGRAKYRWDAKRKVSGQKIFAIDFRAKDMPGWPDEQAYAFFIKANRTDKVFDAIDLSSLDADLHPDRLIYHKELDSDEIRVPRPEDLGEDFYGAHLLLPQGSVAPMYGYPLALLIYYDYDRFSIARRSLQHNTEVIKYGADAVAPASKHYGAARFVRIGGAKPTDTDHYSAVKDAVIWGDFKSDEIIWPPLEEDKDQPFIPASVKPKHRGGGGMLDPKKLAEETGHLMRRGMGIAATLSDEIKSAMEDPQKIVIRRSGYSQSIDPSAMEPDNGNAWYDAKTKTLSIVIATQSPYDTARYAAEMVKGNKKFPVEHIKIIAGATVGYGSKDHSIFPFYVIAACFYGNGKPVRLANNRYDQFQMGIKRHSADMNVSIVADRNTGLFEILKGEYHFNGGGRENFSFSVAQAGATAAQSGYYFPKSDLIGAAFASKAVEAGSMRGYGSLQTMSMTELIVDELAQELGMDAIELRKKNVLKPQFPNTQGAVQLGDPRLEEMLLRAAQHPIWINRSKKKAEFDAANPGYKYGVGFAQSQKNFGSGSDSCALVLEFTEAGSLVMRHCAHEIGTGVTTAQQIIVQNIIGKAPDEAEFSITDFPELPLVSNFKPYTNTQAEEDEFAKNPFWVPNILPAMSASNSAYFVGFGTRQAAQFLLEFSIWPAAKALWSEGGAGGELASGYMTHNDLRVVAGGIGGGGMAVLSFAQIAARAHQMGLITGVAVHCFSRWQWAMADFDLPGFGPRKLPIDALAIKYGAGAADSLKQAMTSGGYHFIERKNVYFPPTQRNNAGVTTYTPAACLVELSVNTFTGDVHIMRHHNLLAPGHVIVPELLSGQQQGGVAMGIGHALLEDMPLYENGPGNGSWNFNRYTLPRAADVAVWAQSVEYLPELSDTSPSKGMGEIVSIPVIAATGNAIAHAIGKHLYSMPWTAEKIKKALNP